MRDQKKSSQQGFSVLRWGLRIALIGGLLMALGSPQPRTVLGPPQTVDTQHDHLCVHTRLIDEVQPWVIQESLSLVREMGATTIVEFFPWAYHEPRRGQYNWQQADRIIRHARNQGLTVIARMGYVPAWAQETDPEQENTLNTLPLDSYDEFADFVATFATRYAADVSHLVIWNEPNLAFEWGYRDVPAANYVRLLETVYPAVKAANPAMQVLAGALAPTLEPPGSALATNELVYLDAMLAAGLTSVMDGYAVHTYGFTHPALDPPATDRLNFRRAELQFERLANAGLGGVPIYITESGWNDHPRWTQSVRPSQRIQYTLDAYRYADEAWPQMQVLCLWAFRFPTPTLRYPDGFTLVTTDFQKRPIYDALQAYARNEYGGEPLWRPRPVPSSDR